jgi:hypothetical protein
VRLRDDGVQVAGQHRGQLVAGETGVVGLVGGKSGTNMRAVKMCPLHDELKLNNNKRWVGGGFVDEKCFPLASKSPGNPP